MGAQHSCACTCGVLTPRCIRNRQEAELVRNVADAILELDGIEHQLSARHDLQSRKIQSQLRVTTAKSKSPVGDDVHKARLLANLRERKRTDNYMLQLTHVRETLRGIVFTRGLVRSFQTAAGLMERTRVPQSVVDDTMDVLIEQFDSARETDDAIASASATPLGAEDEAAIEAELADMLASDTPHTHTMHSFVVRNSHAGAGDAESKAEAEAEAEAEPEHKPSREHSLEALPTAPTTSIVPSVEPVSTPAPALPT